MGRRKRKPVKETKEVEEPVEETKVDVEETKPVEETKVDFEETKPVEEVNLDVAVSDEETMIYPKYLKLKKTPRIFLGEDWKKFSRAPTRVLWDIDDASVFESHTPHNIIGKILTAVVEEGHCCTVGMVCYADEGSVLEEFILECKSSRILLTMVPKGYERLDFLVEELLWLAINARDSQCRRRQNFLLLSKTIASSKKYSTFVSNSQSEYIQCSIADLDIILKDEIPLPSCSTYAL